MKVVFDELFKDHEDLSDFIWQKNGIKESLVSLRHQARTGCIGCNDGPTLWLRRFVSAIGAEVQELDESIPWKWWRGEKTDVQNVCIELVDIFHFVLSAATCAGMTGAEFIDLYYKKRKLNYDRQIVGFRQGDNRQIKVR